MEELKQAYESKEISAIDTALENINNAWKSASEDIYKAQQAGGSSSGAEYQDTNQQQAGGDNNVQDVDFEEVK